MRIPLGYLAALRQFTREDAPPPHAASSARAVNLTGRRVTRRYRQWSALAASLVAATLVVAPVSVTPALSQVLVDGNAALTGFSGVVPPVVVAPGVNPLDKTYIDPNGVSVRVIDLQNMGGPPKAQVVTAPKPFSIAASQVGQVFGVALDDASPPNIYVAATSAYGLPIVVPDMDGDGLADRVKQGAPNAFFMPGLFGPAPGGPGSIWRIDGASGTVQLVANVTLNGAANPGPALGGLAFDAASQSLFVADRATGMIHQFGLDGSERGRFDHGVQGRPAAGAPPVPYNPATRLDITSPAFSSENPATWRYAPASRLVFGLAVHDSRLYYAVAEGLQVWSVSIAGGSFGKDPRIEVTVPPSLAPTEISKIVFDARGRMLLAERAAPTGDYAMIALAQEGISRVLRYTPVSTGNPASPHWQALPDDYAIGFPAQMANGNGGIAIGYRYTADGALDRASCGGFLWSSGERLRVANDVATTLSLALGGPAAVNGMQGNDVELVAPANVPPWTSYFIDKDDRFDDPAARGQIGDLAIPRSCERLTLRLPPTLRPWFPGLPGIGLALPPAGPFCPWPGSHGCTCLPGQPCSCPPGTTQQPGLQCCPYMQVPGPTGQCASLCANGATDTTSVMLCYEGLNPPADPNNIDPNSLTCWNGTPVDPNNLQADCPKPPGAQCPAGFTLVPAKHDGNDLWSDYTCDATPQENMCPQPGPNGGIEQIGLDGQCHELCSGDALAFPITQCCPAGMVPNAFGICGPPQQTGCPPQQMTSTGQCCPQGQIPLPNGQCGKLQQTCPPQQLSSTGQCCPQGQKPQPDGTCNPSKLPLCPPQQLSSTGQCCPQGQFPQPDGSCGGSLQICPPGQTTSKGVCCPAGQTPQPDGTCGQYGYIPCPQQQLSVTGVCCPAGSKPQPDGSCQSCPAGTVTNPLTGACTQQQACPANTVQKPNGQCCPPPGVVGAPAAAACFCPTGQTFDGQKCVGGAQPASGCFPGYVHLSGGGCCLASQATLDGVCCPPGQHPDANRRSCVGTAPLLHITPPGVTVPPVVVPPPHGLIVPPPPPRIGFKPPPPHIGVTPPPPHIGVTLPPRIVVPPRLPPRLRLPLRKPNEPGGAAGPNIR